MLIISFFLPSGPKDAVNSTDENNRTDIGSGFSLADSEENNSYGTADQSAAAGSSVVTDSSAAAGNPAVTDHSSSADQSPAADDSRTGKGHPDKTNKGSVGSGMRSNRKSDSKESDQSGKADTGKSGTYKGVFSSGKSRSSKKPKDKQGRVLGKDKYQTDPVPSGKPVPVEPKDVDVNQNKKYTCTFSIRCDSILDHISLFDQDKLSVLPKNGTVFAAGTVAFSEGESVFDLLKRVTRDKKIQLEFEHVPIYNSAHIEGIHNLYEFDCGALSGWTYRVNQWFPNYGCSRYQVKDGDVVEWLYTCNLGKDVGNHYSVING